MKVNGDCLEIADILGDKYAYQSCWSSPEVFSRYVKSLNPNNAWQDAGWEKGSFDFTGTKSMEEALHLADGHWDEGADKVQRMVDLIHANRPTRKFPKKYVITGALPSVPRAVSGNILNMLELETGASKRRPVITLISNMCVNWTVDKDVLSNKSAAVTAVIDEIESAGYSVEVISTAITGGRWEGTKGYMAATSVMAKTSDQPVDIKRLAFSLGHPSMFRRMVFSDWGSEPSAERGLGHGLGHVNDPEPNGTDALAEKHIYKIPPTEGQTGLFADEDKSMTIGLDSIIASLIKQKCPCFRTWQFSKEYKKYCADKKIEAIDNDF